MLRALRRQPMSYELTSSQLSVAAMPILSEQGEILALMIEDKIISDPINMQYIRYALAQRGEDEVRDPRGARTSAASLKDLETKKEKIPALWKRQEVVL